MKKNKLPRKRKKAMIKAEGILSYIAAQVCNDLNLKEKGESDFLFRKLKVIKNRITTVGFW